MPKNKNFTNPTNKAWNQFLKNQGNIYHTPEMFEVFKETKNQKPTLITEIDAENNIQALAIAITNSAKGGIFTPITTRTQVFGSIAKIDGLEGKIATKKVIDKIQKNESANSMFIELRPINDDKGVEQIAIAKGWNGDKYINYVFNLQKGEENLLSSMYKSKRKNILRGLRNQRVKIKEIKTQDELTVWYDTLKKSFLRSKTPLPHISLFKSAMKHLLPKNMVRFCTAEYEGKPIAANARLNYKTNIQGWFIGMDYNYRNQHAVELMHWNTIQWGINNNYTTFNLGGARANSLSRVAEFKKQFGTDTEEFGRQVLITSPIKYKLAETVYFGTKKILLKYRK